MSFSYPLDWPAGWPRTEDRSRTESRFRVTPQEARRALIDELSKLGAAGVVVSTNRPLRADGMPYADPSRGEDPGVAVYFSLRDKPMAMARDNFLKMDANLRSIGHAVAHLRGLERHGGATMMNRAFEGFAALAAPGVIDWRSVLQLSPGASKADVEAAFRRLARERHPDRGGSVALMADLNFARERGRLEAKD